MGSVVEEEEGMCMGSVVEEEGMCMGYPAVEKIAQFPSRLVGYFGRGHIC